MAESRGRRGFLGALPDPAASALLAIALIAFFEIGSRSGWLSSLILPAPSAVWRALTDGFARGIYAPNIVSTLSATGIGFAISALLAIAIAGTLASIPRLERILMPFIVVFQTLPKIAVAPLVILWLGFDQPGKITIVTISCFFPVLINSLQGLRVRERDQLELMRSLGASNMQLFAYVRVPNAVPYVFAGLHIGLLFALIGAVVAEFVGSRAGLGYLMIQEKSNFNVPGEFAILVLLAAIGLTLHLAMVAVERRVAFWAKDIATLHE